MNAISYKKFLIAAIIAFAIGALSVPTTHAQFPQGGFPVRFYNSDNYRGNDDRDEKGDKDKERDKENEKKQHDDEKEEGQEENVPVIEVKTEIKEEKTEPKKEKVIPTKPVEKKPEPKKEEVKAKAAPSIESAYYDPEYTTSQVTEDYYAPVKLDPVVSKMLGGIGGLTGIAGMMLAIQRPRKLAMRLFSIIP